MCISVYIYIGLMLIIAEQWLDPCWWICLREEGASAYCSNQATFLYSRKNEMATHCKFIHGCTMYHIGPSIYSSVHFCLYVTFFKNDLRVIPYRQWIWPKTSIYLWKPDQTSSIKNWVSCAEMIVPRFVTRKTEMASCIVANVTQRRLFQNMAYKVE